MTRKYVCSICVYLIVTSIILSGCGETVRGAWQDIQRIGRGIRTIFIAE